MIVDPVTARWAAALFEVALRKGALDEVTRDVERIGAELERPGARAFLLGGETSAAERRAKLLPLLAGFHELTRNFVHLLLDRRREAVLRDLPRAFGQRVLVHRGAVEGVALAPRQLEAPELERLAGALSGRFGKRVLLTSRVDPELIAGVRVLVGAKMIDHSVRGRLDHLRQRMLDAPLPVAR